jgi:hypothetical protein
MYFTIYNVLSNFKTTFLSTKHISLKLFNVHIYSIFESNIEISCLHVIVPGKHMSRGVKSQDSVCKKTPLYTLRVFDKYFYKEMMLLLQYNWIIVFHSRLFINANQRFMRNDILFIDIKRFNCFGLFREILLQFTAKEKQSTIVKEITSEVV